MKNLLWAITAGALLAAAPAMAQPETPIVKEEVSFDTVDGVLLKGTFYPSPKGGASPVIMMLHKIGGKRTEGDWEGLAVRLQKKGNAVLIFDFRCHGASTIIEPGIFWNYPHNRPPFLKIYRPSLKKLELADMKSRYIPYLMNDIAAARYYLDNRNDNGQCNTSNIIVIGAEDGASLGFAFIATEFYRPAVYQKIGIFQINPAGGLNNDPAGDDYAGAIWLSYRRHPGIQSNTTSIPYSYWGITGTVVALRDKVQMWFATGEKDEKGQADAKYLYDNVLKADRAKEKLDLTSKSPIKGTELRGIALVGAKGLDTDNLIDKFIDRAVKLRPNQSQKKRNASEFKPTFIDPHSFGFFR